MTGSADRYRLQHIDRWWEYYEANEQAIARRRRKNRFFHREIDRMVAASTVPGAEVVDLGCADGATLAACLPARAIGVDLSPEAVASARERLPEGEIFESAVEEWVPPGNCDPDYVIASLLLDQVYDIYDVLRGVRRLTGPDARVIIVTYSRLWQPAIRLAELLRLKSRAPGENYVPWKEVENLLEQSNLEVVKRLDGILIPVRIPLLSTFVNRWMAPLPLLRVFAMVRVTVARPVAGARPMADSLSVVVAARNEQGNIRELVDRLPVMAERQELVFVEGHSTDETWQEICRVAEEQPRREDFTIVALQQSGKGKGDAVRAGFAAATGDVLMILDADLSVPPEELPRFLENLDEDHCEFANGSRLVYPMDDKAMRFLNLLGNKFFGALFSYLLAQPVKDTLCGTKVLRRDAYLRIAANRDYFGDFDPFGDFDLLFGAARLGLKIRDVQVHYKERTYGQTNISRFRHGWLLLRMSAIAARRLKFVG